MRVQEIMTTPAFTCQSNQTLEVPAKLMWEHDCGAILIVDDRGKLVGIVTDRDICMAAFTQARPLHDLEIHIAMSKGIASVRAEQDVADVEALMTAKRIRRVPVVDAANKPIGIVTANDLTRDAARPTTRLQGGPTKLVQTLASICQPRPQA